MKTVKVVSIWIAAIVVYLSGIGFTQGRYDQRNPMEDCSVYNTTELVTLDEARILIQKYDDCKYRQDARSFNKNACSIFWPIYLPISYGSEFFESEVQVTPEILVEEKT